MKKHITLSDKSGSNSYILPVVPVKIPKTYPSKNQEFETIDGVLNIIGNVGLTGVSWESFFPTQKYTFMETGSSPDGWAYIDFLNNARKNKLPIRYVETDDNKHTILNMLASIESFEITYTDKAGNIHYSISLKEWKSGT